MLKVNNLTKFYKPKKGERVLALDNVSFELPETGMIFLLGKSGSGKSTLLNLIGGLDSYTSGEIIIKGRSSANFKTSDFDSYRNTFIGFIFQEFNILEDYSVGKNIALALELQQKKAERAEIEKLMGQVDLDKLHFDRKIGELSGGQKQRVAIARALIKNPDILMADEPTGALDSKTGEQVFDTLKKLSKEKLVIVVSHDRESAEKYGDRIIELADGIIIDDKVNKDGAFVKTAKEDIHIKDYKDGDFKLVKSKLNFRDSLIMGLAGLKQKRLRLFFTILLSVFAFMLFGLSATSASYNQYKSEIATAKNNGQETMLISSIMSNKEMSNTYGSGFTQENIEEIERLTGNKVLKQVFKDKNFYEYHNIDFMENLAALPSSAYFATNFNNLLEVDSETSANLIPAALGSRLPNAGNNTEIAISDYIADSFVEYNLLKNETVIEINSYEDLLGETIILTHDRNTKFEMQIVGVYKTDIDKEMYASYKTKEKISSIDQLVLTSREYLIFTKGFVCKDFYIPQADYTINARSLDCKLGEGGVKKLYSVKKSNGLNEDDVYLGGRELSSLQENEVIINSYIYEGNYNTTTSDIIKTYFDEATEQNKILKLYQNDILIGEYKVAGIVLLNKSNEIYVGDSVFSIIEEYQSKVLEFDHDDYVYLKLKSDTSPDPFDTNPIYYPSVWKASEYDLSTLDIYWGKNATPKTQLKDNEIIIGKYSIMRDGNTYDHIFKGIFDSLDKDVLLGKTIYIHPSGRQSVNGKEVKIVGMYMGNRGVYIASEDVYNHCYNLINNPISIMIKLSDNWNKNKEVFDYLESLQSTDKGITTRVKLSTTATDILDAASMYTQFLIKVFIYAACVFSLFAGLLLMNFIGQSIQNKKKEIGILRAIGARSLDIFKIFSTESLIIGLINFIVSYIVVVVLCVVVNNIFTISFLIPGILTALLMLAVSLFVATLATLIPTYKIAKKKPIDAINNR